MEYSKDLQFVLKQINSNYAVVYLTIEECDLLNNFINLLIKENEKLNEVNQELENKLKEIEETKNVHNARLFATWQQSNYGEIYRTYYILFNGKIFNSQVYTNEKNCTAINSVPTYLNADVQCCFKGLGLLKDLEEMDYITFKKIHSGI